VSGARTLQRLLSGTCDAAIRFDELVSLLDSLGFVMRIKGSHHLFHRAGIEEKINLQHDGSHAKPYQVRQVRSVILKYGLGDIE
jgi:predicted RNA binding protein YcfA (HicA-like mRNA interferase family)